MRAKITLLTVLICSFILTGCGQRIAEYKIGKEARYYIADKYGFRPGTTGVELDHVGELEGVWHKKDGGTASMEYKGHTFKVYVSLVDPSIRYDDYLKPDLQEYLTDHFKTELECKDLHVFATYGRSVCMVSQDIETVEEILAKCDNIEIYVSTCGLDQDRVSSLDVSALGDNTKIYIIDWSFPDCVADEELIMDNVVGLESETYTSGFSKIMSYYCFENGEVRSKYIIP
ncbi:MAG: hypothetical protein IKO16_04525 [Lachnospiraceae bacterium]|nr:hypothetical protein [Lachnospiraceae bacterium]